MFKKLNKAVILAAGRGSRLQKTLKGKPKPLLKIENKSLIRLLIDKLEKLKIKKIIVVTGFKSQLIKKEIKKNVKFIHYPYFNKTNNLHTLLHIKNELKEPFLCLFSDVIFEIKILKNLLSANGDIVIAIDKNSNLSGTMRVKLNKGYVIDVGNHISLKSSDGNFIGFSKFSQTGAHILRDSLQKFKNSNYNDYYTVSLNKLIKEKKKVNFVDVGNSYWKEIDTKADYETAKKIYKKIVLRETN